MRSTLATAGSQPGGPRLDGGRLEPLRQAEEVGGLRELAREEPPAGGELPLVEVGVRAGRGGEGALRDDRLPEPHPRDGHVPERLEVRRRVRERALGVARERGGARARGGAGLRERLPERG